MGRALLHAYPLQGGTFIATPQQLEVHGSMLSLEWAKLRPAEISDVSWDMCAFEVKGSKHQGLRDLPPQQVSCREEFQLRRYRE